MAKCRPQALGGLLFRSISWRVEIQYLVGRSKIFEVPGEPSHASPDKSLDDRNHDKGECPYLVRIDSNDRLRLEVRNE
jgi:hypothetical protein